MGMASSAQQVLSEMGLSLASSQLTASIICLSLASPQLTASTIQQNFAATSALCCDGLTAGKCTDIASCPPQLLH